MFRDGANETVARLRVLRLCTDIGRAERVRHASVLVPHWEQYRLIGRCSRSNFPAWEAVQRVWIDCGCVGRTNIGPVRKAAQCAISDKAIFGEVKHLLDSRHRGWVSEVNSRRVCAVIQWQATIICHQHQQIRAVAARIDKWPL